MAAASDKARYYLERGVPELQEYERNGIFSHEEITAIASKRSNYEHLLHARGAKASDFAQYAAYEMNLDVLRKKRSKRMGVQTSRFNGQRNVFLILDRATKRHPGDTGLWMQYISYCRKEGSNKKLAKIFTSVLRLRPQEHGLWILAAKHYAEDLGDMSTARSYMHRGLRFCKHEKRLWLEYMRLEMQYLSKLAARRKLLGLDTEQQPDSGIDQDMDADMLTLPTVSVEEFDAETNKGMEAIDPAALKKMASASAFNGSIPIAVFDSAMQEFADDAEFAEALFDAIATFKGVPSRTAILQHIMDYLRSINPGSTECVLCEARLLIDGYDAESVEFPSALGSALDTISKGLGSANDHERPRLARKAVALMVPFLNQPDLDVDVRAAITASIRRYTRLEPAIALDPDLSEQLLKVGIDINV